MAKTNVKASKPETVAEEYDRSEAGTNRYVDIAIASSTDHYRKMHVALAVAFWFAAEHGRSDALARLFKNVKPADQESIRLFRVNIARSKKFGGTYVDDNGREQATDFLRYVRDTGQFQFIKPDGSEKSLAAKRCREAVKSASIDDLLSVPMFNPQVDAGERQERAFDLYDKIAALIKTAIREGWGSKSDLSALNRIIPDKADRVDIDAAERSAAEALERAKLKVERATEKMRKAQERYEAHHKPEATEPEADTAEAETSKAA